MSVPFPKDLSLLLEAHLSHHKSIISQCCFKIKPPSVLGEISRVLRRYQTEG